MSIIQKIKMYPLTDSQYINEAVNKSQIYIHHTAGNPNPYSAIDDWNLTPVRVGTAFVIAGYDGKSGSGRTWKSGEIIQAFNSAKWGYHLGLTAAHRNVVGSGAKPAGWLDKHSVGIEICNWGGLTLKDGKFMNWAKREVPTNEVVEYDSPYKGYKYFQKYDDKQLESTRELLIYLCDRYSIPKTYFGDKIFGICHEALRGQSGIWTHTSVRPDKSDCHPQKELKQMLASL